MSDITNPNNDTQAVTNPATQTLFRFVSLRNPQLAKKEGNVKFIFRKEEFKGIFDGFLTNGWVSSGKTKIDFLTEKAKSADFDFTKIYRTEDSIKNTFNTFYTESKKHIANNEASLNDPLRTSANNLSVDDKKKFWDSLIYQILTQEDFYVKELLTQLLQTLHYIENYSILSAEVDSKKKKIKQKEISTAKVVIPDSLFIDSVPVDGQSTVFTVGSSAVGSNDSIAGGTNGTNASNIVSENISYFPTESVLKKQKVALATYEKEQLENLKKELVKTQTLYNKQYTKAYDIASKDYQALIKPLYDAYEHQLLQVEATFTEQMTPASKKLALNQVAKPEIPDFEFEFRAERDVTFLKNKLSESSLKSFVDLIGESVAADSIAGRLSSGDILPENIVAIGEDQFILPADENQSFVEMLGTIDEKLSALNEEIYQNTEVEKQEYVSVGGILIPASQNKVSNDLYNATICFRSNYQDVEGYCIEISCSTGFSDNFSIKNYRIVNNSSVIKEDSFVNIFNNGNQLSFNSFFNNLLTLSDFQSATLFSINCLINGEDYTINVRPSGTEECQQVPILKTNTTANGETGFIPKGFGIKRLGIADYLKVEQSTHAYVEGEVANIENIMAREYREKSTRRLRRSETTETTSSDTEREQLTDTTTASRFEMQSEVAKILQESTDMGVSANTRFSVGGSFSMDIGASYANHRSKEDSMRQAVTQAQDVTARALDRVVTKVHQERIEKIVEEFEENNSHGFDNRKGNTHVVGVYRWVDKLMKNQVWNYGKRLMFEFAVPQPAKLHLLAMNSRDKIEKIIEKPIDPKKSVPFNLSDYAKVADDTVRYWSSIYNVEIEAKQETNITIGKSLSGQTSKEISEIEFFNLQDEIQIPEGYKGVSGNVRFNGATDEEEASMNIAFGDQVDLFVGRWGQQKGGKTQSFETPYFKTIPISATAYNEFSGTVNFNLNLELTQEAKKQWQQKTFNAIIEAYENAMTEYNNKVAEEETKANNIKGSNPLFYRQIEQEVLKHNCIAYLTDDKSKTKNIGTQMYTGNQLLDFKVNRTDIDEYTSFAKFMEQAFEWDIMSYNLYPYYWGNKTEWGSMYVSEDADPLFRSFLRSGMARVVVTVRPGFEDAVQFYMATGRLWNGGEVPVIGDPMYLSIVDELKDIKGETQGKPWITRIPTPLTILQAQNIGLEVTHALPFTAEDPLDFENPEEVITESNFYPSDAQMEAEKSKLIENIEINNDYLQLTNNDTPHQVIAQLSLDDLKTALE